MAKSTRTTTKNVLSMPRPTSRTRKEGLSTNLTPGDIATRAFELYCSRGCQDGNDVEDWLQAERELLETASSSAA